MNYYRVRVELQIIIHVTIDVNFFIAFISIYINLN